MGGVKGDDIRGNRSAVIGVRPFWECIDYSVHRVSLERITFIFDSIDQSIGSYVNATEDNKMSMIKMEGDHHHHHNATNTTTTIGDSFLNTSQQYIVHADAPDGDDSDMGMAGGGHDDHSDGGSKDAVEPLREQDRFLPIANVARIMKVAIPKSGKIAKDAKECVQECVSEFVSFITSEASDRCHQEKRKTINGEDILFAMSTLGFDNYVEPLKLYLQKYREAMKGEKGSQPPGEGNALEELSDESFGGQSLNATMLSEDGSQPNVIYTTYAPSVFKLN